jgi:gas vesicle protein
MVFDDGDEFVLGVVIGALIGAGVALILAPDSGRRTRRRIRRSAEDLSEAAGDRLQTFVLRPNRELE